MCAVIFALFKQMFEVIFLSIHCFETLLPKLDVVTKRNQK